MLLRRWGVAWAFGCALAAPAAAHAAEVTFDLRIERGQVPQNMRRIRVTQGDAVRLRWRADRATIVHLHGYDIETNVAPGAVAEMSFTARATGKFPVSVHKPKAGGGHAHDPPLAYIEVYPR
jgi:hypothetical protein